MEGIPIGRSSAAVQFAVGQLRAVASGGSFLKAFHLDLGDVPGGPQWAFLFDRLNGSGGARYRSGRLGCTLTPSNTLDCVCAARDGITGQVAVFTLLNQPPLQLPTTAWSFWDAVDLDGRPVVSTADVALLASPSYPPLVITANGRQVSVWVVAHSALELIVTLPETADPVVAIGAVHSTVGTEPVAVGLGDGAIEIVVSCQPPGRPAYLAISTSTGVGNEFTPWQPLQATMSEVLINPAPITASGPFAFFISNWGQNGNYEMLVPAGSTIRAFWRNNDDPAHPWTEMAAPTVPAGMQVIAVTGFQSPTEEVPPNGDFFVFAQLRPAGAPADGSQDEIHEFRRYGLVWNSFGRVPNMSDVHTL